MKGLQLFSKLEVLLCAAGILAPTALTPAPVTFSQPAAAQAVQTESPVARQGPQLEGDLVRTIENVPIYGSVKVFSPTGSAVTLHMVTQPEKGAVTFDGNSFLYSPFPGERGEDSFTVAGEDLAGNLSNEVVIAISVDAAAGLPRFSDMNRHPYEYSAIKLADAGVLSGESVGTRQFFYPDREVSRGDFVVQLLSARGWDSNLPVCINTGLTNDGEIPLWMKPYVRSAIDRGLIKETSFDCATIPTRAEAVVLTDRAAGIDDVLKYNLTLNDRPAVPDWAMQSYLNLAAYRMLDCYDGFARPQQALDRGYAASLLWQLNKRS